MLRIAIVDDEKKLLDHTQALIREIVNEPSVLIDSFQSGQALDIAREKTEYDLYVLDIEIGEENGIDIAKEIRKNAQYAEIIFVTSFEKYALDGYEAHPLGYLVKPLAREKMEPLLQKVVEKRNQPGAFVEITEDYRKQTLPVDEIVALVRKGRKTQIHMYNHDFYETNESMKSLSQKINIQKRWVPISRNTMIRSDLVTTLEQPKNIGEKHKVIMKNGSAYEANTEGITFLKKAILRLGSV